MVGSNYKTACLGSNLGHRHVLRYEHASTQHRMQQSAVKQRRLQARHFVAYQPALIEIGADVTVLLRSRYELRLDSEMLVH